MTKQHFVRAVTAFVALWCAAAMVNAATIYVDSFGGLSTAGLNGATPNTRNGVDGGSASATWSAQSTVFKADGSVAVGTPTNGTAVLPFTPQIGKVYTLSADVNPTVGGTDWIALGFEQLNAPASPFISPTNNGFAWILARGNRGVGGAQSFLGSLAGDPMQGDHDTPSGSLALTVILDTTPSAWTVQWLINGASVRGPVAYTTNPPIGYVGFSKLGNAAGTIDNLSLTSVPEPSTTVPLLALSLLVRRRTRTAVRLWTITASPWIALLRPTR